MGCNSMQLSVEVKRGHQIPWGYEMTVDVEHHAIAAHTPNRVVLSPTVSLTSLTSESYNIFK